MKRHPWRELKTLENKLTDLVATETAPKPGLLERLRELFDLCSTADDADQAICFYGSKSLLAQSDGDIEAAIEYREIEAKLIQLIYEYEEKNRLYPGFAT